MSLDSQTFEKVWKLAQSVCETHECRLYDVEFSQGPGGRALRIYIDRKEGVSLNDCANVSRGLNEFLDQDEDFIPGAAYALEVSSPGLERKLKRVEHFEGAQGQLISIKTKKMFSELSPQNSEKLGKRRQAEALLTQMKPDAIEINFEGISLDIPYQDIDKASVLFQMNDEVLEEMSPKQNKKKRS